MARKPAKPGLITRIVLFIRGTFGLNIATAVMGIVLAGVLVSVAFYMSAPKIESYQVTSGPLSRNETFTGLAIHEENVVSSNASGYINYYAREGTKINANGVVLGVSSGRQTEVETNVSQEDLAKIRDEMMSFSKSFSSSNYIGTYSFKYQVEGSILQYSGISEEQTTPDAVTAYDLTDSNGNLQSMTVNTDAAYGNQTLNKAENDGIVLYSKDNYTGKKLEDLTGEDFQQNSYHEVDLKTNELVSQGQDVYTLITDERWSLLIPLSDRKAARLSDRTVMRVKFLKDDMTQTGDFEIIEVDGAKYGKIDFNKGLVRYAADRFLEVELVTNTVSGLRIPLTSIITKEFYVIPDQFAFRDYSGTTNEFHRATGSVEDSVINTRVYASVADEIHRDIDDEDADITQTYTLYVEKSAFKEGDVLVSPDGNSQFTVGETESLEGVYCINQGYAVFCRIEVLDQNEEYAVVSRYTSYGVSKYDRIVRNADKVKEEDILY